MQFDNIAFHNSEIEKPPVSLKMVAFERYWIYLAVLKRVMGFEPTMVAWEATALPLGHTREIEGYFTMVVLVRKIDLVY